MPENYLGEMLRRTLGAFPKNFNSSAWRVYGEIQEAITAEIPA